MALGATSIASSAADVNTAAAQAEMATLASALDQCAIDTNYYVSLETLNDLGLTSTTPTWDALNHDGGSWVIPPADGSFKSSRLNLLTAYNSWQGPYLTYQSGTTQTGSTPYDQGSPLDPWGVAYRLYTPLGLVRGDTPAITHEDYSDAFDRYMIVSYGPDGEYGGGDDLSYSFGPGVLSSMAAARLTGDVQTDPANAARQIVAQGAEVALNGYNFGETKDDGQVLIGGGPVAEIAAWSDGSIEFTMPSDLTGPATLQVTRAGAESNILSISLTGPAENSVTGWVLFN